jgi:tetratricopeptide (TPR) repeat protein
VKTLGLALFLSASLALADDPCTSAATTQEASSAQALVKQKKFQAAEAPARDALGKCPTQPTAVWALGFSLVSQKRFGDAVKAMSDAIGARPDLAYAYLWRGQSYYSMTQPGQAVGDFQNFLRLAPNAPEAASVKQILAVLQQ